MLQEKRLVREPCRRKQWVVSDGQLIEKARLPFCSREKRAVAELVSVWTGSPDCWERVMGREVPRHLGVGAVTGLLAHWQR